MRRPIAGIPAWGWALVIAGTIVAYAWIQRLRDGDGVGVAPETLPYPDGQSPSDAGDIPGVPSLPDREIEITTNPAWIRYVTDKLVADGYSPTDVGNALTKVLSGLEVTAQEAALWNEAVRRFGAPPEGHPPIVIIKPTTPTVPPPIIKPPVKPPVKPPAPIKPKPTPPPAYWSVRVVKYTTKSPPWNSTISGIAAHYKKASWQSVWNDPKNGPLRAKRGRPEGIRPGDVVYVRK